MTEDEPSIEQPDKEVEQLRKDLKKLGEEIEMMIENIGKRDNIGKNIDPYVLNMLLKEPFTLSSPVKDHYDIGEIEYLVNHISMKEAASAK